MTSMLDPLVDRLQGFFNRGFFLAGLLPGMVFLAGNLLLAGAVFPAINPILLDFFQLDAASQVLNWFLAFVVAFILAILLSSLNQWLKKFFEGRILPARLRKVLENIQHNKLQEMERKRQDIKKDLVESRLSLEEPTADYDWVKRLKQARMVGDELDPADRTVSTDLKTIYRDLLKLESNWDLINFAEMKKMFDLLHAELSKKPASKIRELNHIQTDFIRLLKYASNKLELLAMELWTEREENYPFDISGIGPTRLANQGRVTREYGVRRYGIDTQKYWLHILRLAKKDEQFSAILDESKTQLDFSISMTAVLGFTTFVWQFLALFFAPTPYPFLLLSLFGIPATLIFYRIILQNDGTYSAAVRSAIDLFRFDLMTELHLPMPENPSQEMNTWNSMTQWQENSGRGILYEHEKKNADGANPLSVDRSWLKAKQP